MSEDTADASVEPPALPARLLAPVPVIIVVATGWLIAVALAFTVPALHHWRPITVAGLGVGLLGTSIFLLQLRSARRGDRGAQRGLVD
jgi:protein-S-isoprenylcysteine O-methyltransferase Ste14